MKNYEKILNEIRAVKYEVRYEKMIKRYENYCNIGHNMKVEERYQD